MDSSQIRLCSGKYNTVSLKDLFNELNNAHEHWGLAIEQRLPTWKSDDIIKLLDSIMWGYPIGTIVVGLPDKYLDKDREIKENSEDKMYVIYDGQQRFQAIKIAFSKTPFTLNEEKGIKEGEKCHVFVDLKYFKESIDEKETNKHRLFFHGGTDVETGCLPFEVFPKDRNKTFTELLSDKRRKYDGKIENEWVPLWIIVSENETEISEEYKKLLEKYRGAVQAIKDKFNTYNISIYLFRQDMNPQNMHNVFVRVNRAGVPLNQTEIFFAGVKKHWPEAEGNLRGLYGNGHIFSLNGIVDLIARIAHVEIKENDRSANPPYLKIELRCLKEDLWKRMKKITTEEKFFKDAVSFVEVNAKRDLGFAVKLINQNLLGNVVIPYYKALREKKTLPQQWSSATPYLLFLVTNYGVLSHWRVFSKIMFQDAWKESNNDDNTEWENPLEGYIETFKTYKYLEDRVKDQSYIGNQILFLSIYQQVLFKESSLPFDNDHIIAYNFALRNCPTDADDTKKMKIMAIINSLGNKWLIDSGLNRSLSNKPPSEKLDELEREVNKVNIIGERGCNIYNEIFDSKFKASLSELEKSIKNKEDIRNNDHINVIIEREKKILRYVHEEHFKASSFIKNSEAAIEK